MSDKTSYTLEVYDPTYNWGEEPDENWSPTGATAFDTFAEAQETAKKYTGVYRTVRINKHVWSEVALYQDGVAVE